MRDPRLIAGGIFAAGFLALGSMVAIAQSGTEADATDGPGPNLVIEVAGQANGRVVIDLSRHSPSGLPLDFKIA